MAQLAIEHELAQPQDRAQALGQRGARRLDAPIGRASLGLARGHEPILPGFRRLHARYGLCMQRPGLGVIAAIVLLGVNLRTVIASLPPLLADIRADLGLSATVAGLLTTLPVVCFGALA